MRSPRGLSAARELTGDKFLISYRLNGREFVPVETPFEDTVALCQTLEKEGVDLLHVSAGSGETPSTVLNHSPRSAPRGCYADLAAAVRAKVKIPVIAVGESTLLKWLNRSCDRGRQILSPQGERSLQIPLPEKASKGDSDRIRRCIGCNQGSGKTGAGAKDFVLYNPEVGREGEGGRC